MQEGPSNGISHAEFEMFTEILKDDIDLFIAYLRRENITELNWNDKEIDFERAKKLATVLTAGVPLTALYLANNLIGANGAKVLAQALPGSEIKILDLSGNNISDKGAIALANVLSKPKSKLLFLKLNNNSISPMGAQALSEALPLSPIQALYLEHNEIGYDGCVQLIKALPGTQLKSLQLKENNWDALLANQRLSSEMLVSQQGFYLRKFDMFELVKSTLRSSDVYNLGFLPKYETIPNNVSVSFYSDYYDRLIQSGRFHISKRVVEIELNHQQIRLSYVPYIALCMTQVSPTQKVKYLNQRAVDFAYLNASHYRTVTIPGRGQEWYTFTDSNREYEIRYAFGILMNLPMEIVQKVINYLPCMQHPRQSHSFEQIDRYFEIISKYHPDGIVLKDEIATFDDFSEESNEKQKEEEVDMVAETLIEKPKAVTHSYNLRDRKRHGSQDKVDSQQLVKKRKTMNE